MAAISLAAHPASAQTGGSYDLTWHTLDGGGGLSTGGTYELHGTIGQPDAGDLTGGGFTLAGGFWAAVTTGDIPCVGAIDCADLDSNNARDDNCVWWECDTGACADTPLTQFADMGGAFGACPPDTFANIHDKNHALTCFSGTSACAGINIDAGGAFGACPPDGFCNIHDANHALTAFAGTNACTCPSGPVPEIAPVVAGTATLRLETSTTDLLREGEVMVRVFIDASTAVLRSYQLDLEVSGGNTGQLELVDIRIEPRKDWVFAAENGVFDAHNISTGRVLAGVDDDWGARVGNGGYLATYTYVASKDAAGVFVVDVVHGDDGQTFLIAPHNGMIEIDESAPALIAVGIGRATRR